MLSRDFYVLTRNLKEFIPRTILQPLLLVFVFTYVFPKIGQGIGGSAGAAQFSTMLIAGVLASVIMFQGIQAVALPMVQEFGYTKEIEDRVLAPLPVELVGVQKIVSGALQCLSPRSSCSRSPSSCRPRRCTCRSTGRCCSPWRRSPASCRRRSG